MAMERVRSGKVLKRLLVTLLVLVLLGAAGLAVYVLWILPQQGIPGAGREGAHFSWHEAFDQQRVSPGGADYVLNNGPATFDLDVAAVDAHCGRLFTNYAAALAYCKANGLATIPSVQLVQGKLKQFDDGLCAALELAVQQDGGTTRLGKAAALRRLLDRLLARLATAGDATRPALEAAAAHVAAAVKLGGADVALDAKIQKKVDAAVRAFLARPSESRPIGFWQWGEPLRRLFRQDRFLSQGLLLSKGLEVCVALCETVSADEALAEAFDRFRAADAALTNPPVYVDTTVMWAPAAKCPSFREICAAFPGGLADLDNAAAARKRTAERFGEDAGFCLISYASSKEYSLLAALKANTADDTMQLIIDAIRDGRLRLEPRPDSGWYDYQWHALETLVCPDRARESVKLFLSDAYRKRLEEAFKTSLTKHRETHIKHLPVIYCGIGAGAPEPIEIGPEFSVEPTATVYLRYGRAYRFLRTALYGTVGRDWLAALHRGNEGDAPVERDLDAELAGMMRLCYGLYELLSVEIGLLPEYEAGEITDAEREAARAEARQWLAALADDADLTRDTRVAVPIVCDPVAGLTRYWATGGVKLQRVVYSYREEPAVSGWVKPTFVPTHYYMPTDVFVEFARPGTMPLTRDEYRALCDGSEDETALRRTLGAVEPPAAAASLPAWIWWAGGGVLAILGLAIVRRKAPRVWWRRGWRIFWAACGAGAVAFGLLVAFEPGCQGWVLLKWVAPTNDQLGLWAVRQFWHDSSPRRVQVLMDLLADEDPQTRYYAARCLDEMSYNLFSSYDALAGVPDVEPRLRVAADDPVVDVAGYAIEALGAFPDAENTAFLIEKLKRSRHVDLLCGNTLTALGQMQRPEALEAILPFTKDPRSGVCSAAAEALSHYDDPRVPPRLLELLGSEEIATSHAGYWGIRRFCYLHKTAADPWRRRFDECLAIAATRMEFSPRYRRDAAEQIEDEALQVKAWLSLLTTRRSVDGGEWQLAYCRRDAASRLGYIGAPAAGALDALMEASEEPNEELRETARDAIAQIRAATRPASVTPGTQAAP